MTGRNRDRLRDEDREYTIIQGSARLFEPREHGFSPVRGLSSTRSSGVHRHYRVRADGALVLDRLDLDLGDVVSAPALFGTRPTFPDWQAEHGPHGTARYDFLPDGIDHIDAPVTLLVGGDYDANVGRALEIPAPSGAHQAASVYPYRLVRELTFERAPGGDGAEGTTFRSSPKVGIRLTATIDHSRALEDIRRRLGHPGGANWFRRLALEAAEHLGSSFHFRAEDFDRSFDFQDMIGKLEAMERDAKE